MSCIRASSNFRLLDGFVGWDVADCAGLTGIAVDDPTGLRLAQENADGNSSAGAGADPFTPSSVVLTYLLPPRLARGCGRCDWFLVHRASLRRSDCCTSFSPAWSERCDQHLLYDAVAVAARGHRVAASDAQAKRIWIWERDGERLIGSIDTERLTADRECDRYDSVRRLVRPGSMAFATWGELLVADLDANSIWRFGPTGEVRGTLRAALPRPAERGSIKYLAVSDDGSIWVVTGIDDRSLELWRAGREGSEFRKASIKELQESFQPTGLKAVDDEIGFCIEQCGPEGLPVTRCFGWDGEPTEKPIAPPSAPRLNQRGQLLTRALDSGIPRCRWHRLRLDADVPSGTNLEIAVATSEPDSTGAEPSPQGNREHEPGWEDFQPGVPHYLDWQVAPSGVFDFLIDQPPGRLLYVRLRLKSNGDASPVVRRVRLDFPRVTSLENLPSVYRENPEAEDFTERFLALFDASLNNLDRAIERSSALLDPEGVPAEVLPWLGSFLDLVFDPAWTPELRRQILRALPDLYRRRGTISGLSDTIKIIFGVTPAIQELATERAWGAVAQSEGRALPNTARLGSVRLFGKSRARFRLNTSALGRAPLKSYGNPDLDPLLAQAFRLRVLVPPLAVTSANARRSLEQLIVLQKPAHTTATVRFGGDGFLLGNRSAVGVDTIFGALPAPVLGKSGNVRLNGGSVLRRGPHGSFMGMRLGETSIVGVRTIAA